MRATCFAQSCFRIESRLLKKKSSKDSKPPKKLGRLGRPLRPGAGNVLCTILFESTSRTHARKRKQGKARKEKARKEGQTEKARKRNQGKKENASKRKKGKGSSEKRGK